MYICIYHSGGIKAHPFLKTFPSEQKMELKIIKII
jgi:hypothetical protein